MALHLWPDLLSRHGRMSCDNHTADQLVQHFLRLEQRMTFDPWIHRAPTEVNVADAPSRGDESQLFS